jgi:5-methylcytosine-specific restriction endonuclease McrA
MYCSAEFGF